LKYFRRVGQGHLINTSSVMGGKVRETAGAYSGTKHAVEALAEALRLELAGSAIKVSCIAPGLVTSELHRDNEIPPAVERNIDRPLAPSEVADAIVYAAQQPPHVNVSRLLLMPQDHKI
jgi:NADP-dependent 3-hydroxy acid dehydrogenase YdfG